MRTRAAIFDLSVPLRVRHRNNKQPKLIAGLGLKACVHLKRSLFRIGVCFALVSASILYESGPAYAQAPRFEDVPTDYWARSFIETLADNGITGGCGGNRYCPDAPVTRAQMAVFLERAINGRDYSPPAATGSLFLDVAAGDFAAAFIEQLAADGITGGCGNNNYCPSSPVTRAQMAVFLLRARYGAGFSPEPATGVFNDVGPGDFAAAFIERLAEEGITSGCGGQNFCPGNQVTRAQMAVFLVRTFEFEPEIPTEVQERLARLSAQYGPILYLHPSEAYFPSTVEWFVAQSELAGSNTDLKCSGGAICDRFDIAQPGDSRQALLNRLVTMVEDRSASYTNLWLETPDTTRSGNLADAESYVHLVDLGNVTDIQYWFFYPFNGPGRARVQFGEIHDATSSLAPLGEHYGDWEAVILRFDNATDELLGAFMSAHGDYTWYPREGLEFDENGHVLAFSTYNGHAIYNSDAPNKFDHRVVHEYAGWRNQCIGGEIWGNCIGVRTDVGIGTLDVDLLDTTARGPSFNAFENYRLVAVDGVPISGEEWIDIDIRWGQQRSGGAADISNEQFRQIMEDQIGIIALVTVVGAAAACNPVILAIPVVGPAFCAAYSISVASALIVAYDRGADLIIAEMVNETFNGPSTPGAKGDEYLYTSCPKESRVAVLCPEDSMAQDEYLVSGARWGGGSYNWMGDIDGDGKEELISAIGSTILIKRLVQEIDEFGEVSTSIQEQEYLTASIWGSGGFNWVADIDGDGKDDIVSAIADEVLVRRFEDNDLGGEFSLIAYSVPNQWGGVGYNWLADVDGDDREELISASGPTIRIKWYKRDYDNEGRLILDEFVQREFTTASSWGGSSGSYNWIGDLDGSGRDEIVSAIGGTVYARRFADIQNPSPGGEEGEFNLIAYTVRSDQWSVGYNWLGDIDGDGADEVLSAVGDFVYVKSFNGSGFDDDSIQYPGSSWGAPAYTWVGDIDGDRKDEIVSVSGATIWIKSFASIRPTEP